MARKKELNLELLITEDKEKKKVHKWEVNENVTLYYTNSIGKKGIDSIMEELFQTIRYAGNNALEYPTTYEHAVEYLQYLIFKHFTNISDKLGFDYNKNILLFEKAYDNYWIEQLLVKVPQEQINKVYNSFNEKLQLEIESQKMLSQAVDKLKNDINNKEALELLGVKSVNDEKKV